MTEPGEPGDKPGERLGSREVFKGRTVRLDVDRVRLPNGREMDFEMIRHPGAAAVVPLLPSGEVLLIRQYRYATGGYLLELPAGKLDPGEAPESCARRELEEETGYRAGELAPLGWIWTTPGFTDERIWLYLATELTESRQELQDDEVLTLEKLPWEEAIAKASAGEIHDCKTVCAILRAAAKRGSGPPPFTSALRP
jgi:ADP-ribose pyrophosphatase